MNTNNKRKYNNVYFDEYLDGGYQDIPYFNQQLLNPSNTTCPHPSGRVSNHQQTSNVKQLLHEALQSPSIQNNNRRKEYLSSLSRICEELLGKAAIDLDFPGGAGRSSYRLHLSDHSTAIMTRRPFPSRASYEANVMRLLHSHNASVPRVLGFNGLVLLQENLSGVRLSEILQNTSSTETQQLLTNALHSLAEIHAIGSHAGLDSATPIVGCSPDWLVSFIDRTAILGGCPRTRKFETSINI